MYYVIDLERKEVVAQSADKAECVTYIRNVRRLFNNNNPMFIADGHKQRDWKLHQVKNKPLDKPAH